MTPWDQRKHAIINEGSRGKQAAGLGRVYARKEVPAPVAILVEDFSIREHACGIRSIPEPTLRRDGNGRDCEFRVSIPFVAFQHREPR
jgi:hypothetical protein